MYAKTITYNDFNGNKLTDTFLFHMSKAELIEMQYSKVGGMVDKLEKIIHAKNEPELFAVIKSVILDSVGEKSDDGKRFVKNKEIRDAFEQSEAYSVLLEELMSDSSKAAEFINKILPTDLASEVSKMVGNGAGVPGSEPNLIANA